MKQIVEKGKIAKEWMTLYINQLGFQWYMPLKLDRQTLHNFKQLIDLPKI
ncbi:MAG: hypothetical protein AAF039_13115 [Bacteroidota bacterium]